MAGSKREVDLARQRAERRAARPSAASDKGKQRNKLLAIIAGVLLIFVGIGVAAAQSHRGKRTDAAAGARPSASSAASRAPGACRYLDGGAASRKVAKPPAEGVETKGAFTATLQTNLGTIAFAMDAAKTPCTTNNMRSLAHFGYFDNTVCHRLTSHGIFVLQCGDPSGKGTGGPGYHFADENLAGATYPRGTVAMANSGPDTNGSQFFLVYKDSQLPPGYTPFGTVTRGLELLDKVARAGSTPPGDGSPNTVVTIERFRTTRKSA